MTYYTCASGPTYTDWKMAGWCQIHMELTHKRPYAMRGHYTPWDWLIALIGHAPDDQDPSYYTVEPFENCSEGARFDSWYKDNYADAFACQNALTRLTGQCYDARLIGTNWFGFRHYEIVPTDRPPEPRSYCEFMLNRAKVDVVLWNGGR